MDHAFDADDIEMTGEHQRGRILRTYAGDEIRAPGRSLLEID